MAGAAGRPASPAAALLSALWPLSLKVTCSFPKSGRVKAEVKTDPWRRPCGMSFTWCRSRSRPLPKPPTGSELSQPRCQWEGEAISTLCSSPLTGSWPKPHPFLLGPCPNQAGWRWLLSKPRVPGPWRWNRLGPGARAHLAGGNYLPGPRPRPTHSPLGGRPWRGR